MKSYSGKLKPCPFCDCENIGRNKTDVYCTQEGCHIRMMPFPEDAWNNRPQERKLELCLEDISVIGIDYDGYSTVDGLKKCIDRITAISQSFEPEKLFDCDGNEVDRL